jgi:hypothetical protein
MTNYGNYVNLLLRPDLIQEIDRELATRSLRAFIQQACLSCSPAQHRRVAFGIVLPLSQTDVRKSGICTPATSDRVLSFGGIYACQRGHRFRALLHHPEAPAK